MNRYEMTQEELTELLEACKPVPVMYISGGTPLFDDPQESANRVWKKLADKYGFIWDTAQPDGRDLKNFKAEPKQPMQPFNLDLALHGAELCNPRKQSR